MPVNLLAKGQRWEVEVQAFDGEVYGPSAGPRSRWSTRPPPRAAMTFLPARPRRVDGLAITGQQPPDADGDSIRYRYAWTRNGQKVEAPPEQAQIPRGTPRKGERWAVEVVASTARPRARRPAPRWSSPTPRPAAVGLALCDGPVPSGTVPEVRVAAPATDADGDPVSYRTSGRLNGKVLAGGHRGPLPAAAQEARRGPACR